MLLLTRYISTSKMIRGILSYEDVPLCHTLELPYLNNKNSISAIPYGLYPIHKSNSAGHGLCFRFSYVPNRSGILIHAGNTLNDTKGCILVGLDASHSGLIYSRKALDRLLLQLPDACDLLIKEKLLCN